MQISDNFGCCALQIISALIDGGYVLKFYETFNSLYNMCSTVNIYAMAIL